MTQKRDLSTHQFPHVYASLGIDISKLGVVMADTEPIHVNELIVKPDPDLYTSPDPTKWFVRGAVAETGAHVTLLYGLLKHGTAWKSEIEEVLRGWTLDEVEIETVGAFDSPTPETDPYVAIIAHVKVTPRLMEGHQRLSFLPHINTFAVYRPHVTIAYVKAEAKNRWLKALAPELVGKKLAVTKINLGEKR